MDYKDTSSNKQESNNFQSYLQATDHNELKVSTNNSFGETTNQLFDVY